MRILLVGSGGREHALCWKFAQNPTVQKIFTTPGNPGTAKIPKNENVSISSEDLKALVSFASSEGIDLTVVGPEKPLVDGIVDIFRDRNLQIFGPSKLSARLEGSKSFAKELMLEADIPTALFEILKSPHQAYQYLKQTKYPIVLKADGLAAGKGVAVCNDEETAKAFVKMVMEEMAFGDAGKIVVAEECLEGEEASFLIATDGIHYVPLASAQDHKRLLEGEKGPNTGGMGAYSPAPVFDQEMQTQTEQEIVSPLLKKLTQKKMPFLGILYVGLMITREGPKVLEFNVRFGDPETQAILPRMESDLTELCWAVTRSRLESLQVTWKKEHALSVVLACEGYPSKPRSGEVISGLDEASKHALIFHSGTKMTGGQLITAGGRVLSVTALGNTLIEASDRAYRAASAIQFQGKIFRKDIGWKAFERKSI